MIKKTVFLTTKTVLILSISILVFFSLVNVSCCPDNNWGSDYLCSDCEDGIYTCDIGICENCGRGTSSGMFSLCNSCGCKLKECQHCRSNLE